MRQHFVLYIATLCIYILHCRVKVKSLKEIAVRLKHFSLLYATVMEVRRTAVAVTLTTVAVDPKQATLFCNSSVMMVARKTVAVDPDLIYRAMLLGTEITVVMATRKKVAANLTAVAAGLINMTSLCTSTATTVALATKKTVAVDQDRDLKLAKLLCTNIMVVMDTRKIVTANLTPVAAGLIKVTPYTITTGMATMEMVTRDTASPKQATWLWTTAMAALVMKVAVILRKATLLCTVLAAMRIRRAAVSPSLVPTVTNSSCYWNPVPS